jgi:hypothetical protein
MEALKLDPNTTPDRTLYLDALAAFVAQRSGIDPRNYRRDWTDKEGHAAFMLDYRRILRDGRDARTMLRYASRMMEPLDVASSATSRVDFYTDKRGTLCVDFTPCQYHATEYRAHACRTLAQAFEHWFRNACGARTLEDVHRMAVREFGRGIASRWFR